MRAFVVITVESELDVASDVLWGLGVRAIEERSPADAERPGDPIELWTSVGESDQAIDRAVQALAGRWEHRVVDVDDVDHDAAQRWRDFAAPMWVTDELVVVPAWQALPTSTRSPADASVDVRPTQVRIEPGGAFGLGDHPTTLLSLRALARLVDSGEPCGDVIDVGCGTGVLAVTAAMLLDRPVRAIDVASAAVEATIDNARRNRVDHLVHADSTDLANVEDDYDVVMANILAPTLVSLADDLRRVTRAGGRLVVSGILADAHRHVLDALAPMRVARTDVLDGWACVELRHP